MTSQNKPQAIAASPTKIARLRALAVGLQAEKAAAAHLAAQGLVLLAANVRVGRYEIDLIAREGDVLVVVEVRARGTNAFARALDSVDARKRGRIRAAAKHIWRSRYANDSRYERMRFDCVAVNIDEDGVSHIEHVRAAF